MEAGLWEFWASKFWVWEFTNLCGLWHKGAGNPASCPGTSWVMFLCLVGEAVLG